MTLRERIAKVIYEQVQGGEWPPSKSNQTKWLKRAEAVMAESVGTDFGEDETQLRCLCDSCVTVRKGRLYCRDGSEVPPL